eukprot:TRINITY_DN71621_c0_g1_i1.p1 TRINITY_DN71621_c0_g1~~TRINITY_DN71621_c0_g1_i1.p1  ORF type:complete len:776 (+),score=224.71 TRINITY_DN71621_c0_g1_i1:186-2330(+)
MGGMGGGPAAGMIPLNALGGGGGLGSVPPPPMIPPAGGPPNTLPEGLLQPDKKLLPPPSAPPGQQPFNPEDGANCDTLAEVGKSAKDYLDMLEPIAIPKSEDDAPVSRQLAVLENNTDLFKMFDVDMHRFDLAAVRRGYHKLVQYADPAKLGREPSAADKARYTKLKQAYTVVSDEQLRAVYRQHCFGISGSGGTPALGHEAALAKSLEMARDLRKAGEERAIVLHKASEVGWQQQQKDQDGRAMRTDTRKTGHAFNLFGDITSSDDDDMLEKERRKMAPEQVLEKSPKYADTFLDKAKQLLMEPTVSVKAAGGAFTVHEEPRVKELLTENPKTVQKALRRIRGSLKQMNWAMTALLQNKESPWRGLETKASLCEHAVIKMLEILKSGLAFGKFNDTHEEELTKVLDQIHRLYMDLFERRGQELLRAAINAELMVVYLLPESEGRWPDGTRIHLKNLQSRADLNGKGGTITGWDYSLQRYTVEVDQKEEKKEDKAALQNPDLLGMGDLDDADEEEENVEEDKPALDIPKKLMLLPKNAQVDLDPAKKKLELLVKDWGSWSKRPRSVSATQDAEAVAAALGPPLESMAGYLRDACSGVSTATACPDGFDLVAEELREALSAARNLAAKLLGEEAKEPPPPPSLTEPPKPIVAVTPLDKEAQALKEAAEVAAMGIQIKLPEVKASKKKKSRSRSRSRRRKRKRSSSSSSRDKKKKK